MNPPTFVAGDVLSFYNYTPDPRTGKARSGTGFRDRDGNLIDPTVVECIVKDPTGHTSTFTFAAPGSPVVKDAVGCYHTDQDSSGLPGSWTFAYKSTGVGQAYAWQALTVEAAPL